MKNAKKAILLTLCAILLVAGSVAGTLAYLTDRSSVENTFTVQRQHHPG
jgi:predicted ribosomally synthesized peptide with SipW-like signal peptide